MQKGDTEVTQAEDYSKTKWEGKEVENLEIICHI